MKKNRIQKAGEIRICVPVVKTQNGRSRLSAVIDFKGENRDVWFEVDEKYGEYLCHERSDAYLIGVLPVAMREGFDIVCEAPVTAQLLYQIRTYLIPSLVRNSKVLYSPEITALIEADPIPNANGVGTGISCGVDSMHAIKSYMDSPYPNLKLTHLVINNVGAFKQDSDQFGWQVNHAREFAGEYGFELIATNSNFAEVFPYAHILVHTYRSCFAVYALQKLWSTYFYASTYDLQGGFSLTDNEDTDAAHYEILSLDVFSTRALKIYSEGAAIDRFIKTRDIADWEPAQKYLHVCVSDGGGNCSKCWKCKRTMVSLDALGLLDKYGNVFDVAGYMKNRRKILRWLYEQTLIPKGDVMVRPAYKILKKDIPLIERSFIYLKYLVCSLKIKGFKKRIKQMFKDCARK